MFSTFAPKALGMIGRKMPPATLGRAIVVELKRRKGSERAEPFGHDDDKELGDLRSRLMRWSADNLEAVRSAKNTVTMPAGFNNRRADNWRMLFTIADRAGEEIAEHARHAAMTIEGSVDTGSVRIKLLADIKTIFDAEQLDRISSSDLAVRLAEIEDSPWAEWGKSNKAITKNQVAQQLKPLSIFPRAMRLPSGDLLKGYDRLSFEDAWERYLACISLDSTFGT